MKGRPLASALLVVALHVASARAHELPSVAFVPQLGAPLPLDAPLRDEGGVAVTLRTLLHAHPAILVLGYYGCVNLCEVVLEATAKNLKAAHLVPGADMEVLALSIDPADTPAAARRREAQVLGSSARPGWHFLTGGPDAIAHVAQATGLQYAVEQRADGHTEFAHPVGILVLSPGGRITRYIPGLAYEPDLLRASLAEAAQDRIAAPAPLRWMRCFHDAVADGVHEGVALAIARGGALLALLALVATFVKLRGRGSEEAA